MTQRPVAPRLLGVALLLSFVLVPLPAGSEIFKWTDASGRLHFTHDLNQVPARYRKQAAEAKPKRGSARIQTYAPPASTTPRAARRSRQAKRATASAAGGRVHKIRVERAGGVMRVMVRINDQLDVPFLLDTGASDVVLPAAAAEQLGLDLSAARTQTYSTANGLIEQKLTILDSVQLGTARVDDVAASVSTTMSMGLLGITFFNHFQYEVDPAAGVVTLRENGLVESGKIRGGRNQNTWRGQFATLRAKLDAVSEMLDDTPRQNRRRRVQLADAHEELERQLEVLDREADDARVPYAWRD